MANSGKFYPGEKKDPLLGRLARSQNPLPVAGSKNVPSDFESHTKPVFIEPIPPQRILIGVLAAFTFFVTAIALYLGARGGSSFDGVSVETRMLLAGFVTVVATSLLIYSNTRKWLLMLLVGLVMGAGLISLPLYLSGAFSANKNKGTATTEDGDDGENIDTRSLSKEELMELIGTEPLEEERARLLELGGADTALGLWLRDLDASNLVTVKEYVIRVMGASLQTHPYPRGERDYLMVVTGIADDIEKLRELAEPLGNVIASHDSVGVVEVMVRNSTFETQPLSLLTDVEGSDFYELNSKELKMIDLNRVSSAVRRLSEVPPTLYREDISAQLIQLLESTWYEDKGELCRALLVWSSGNGKAGRLALEEALQLHQAQNDVPSEMIALCIKENTLDVLPLLHALWLKNSSRWEPWFREAGNPAEKILLRGYDRLNIAQRQSACRILGHIGGADSLPALRVTEGTAADAETRITATSSIQLIEKRLKHQPESE